MKYELNCCRDHSEKWAKVVRYNGRYLVSDRGRVCRFDYDGFGLNILKNSHNRAGYKVVMLQGEDGKRHLEMVHRLVAEAWIPREEGLDFVNHKDENKANNHVSNLEWCTAKYNVNYGTAQERRRESFRLAILKRREGKLNNI